jgi:hypothetical protein
MPFLSSPIGAYRKLSNAERVISLTEFGRGPSGAETRHRGISEDAAAGTSVGYRAVAVGVRLGNYLDFRFSSAELLSAYAILSVGTCCPVRRGIIAIWPSPEWPRGCFRRFLNFNSCLADAGPSQAHQLWAHLKSAMPHRPVADPHEARSS